MLNYSLYFHRRTQILYWYYWQEEIKQNPGIAFMNSQNKKSYKYYLLDFFYWPYLSGETENTFNIVEYTS